ncbi:MAG TPA: hypothetical protein VKY73_06690 [Polyangiaceae bacterium]|nr:hypothetical protein [Polyangiaceae bacterium]
MTRRSAPRCAARALCRLLEIVLFFFALGIEPASAAPHGYFNRPEDDWNVTETRYFRIYFTDETPNTAARLAAIADATFERLRAFYGYEPPDKITVSIVGYTSFTNGFAESQRNRITLYTTPANFHSRSRVPWLENVFTHELSHVFSLNAAQYASPRVPVVIGAGVARSANAQGLVRVPLYGSNYPHWFVEGVAQFDTALLGRDAFDENRRAFQRASVEDALLFPLGRLAFFGDERWYNTGFAFLAYLEERFGRGTVHRLFRAAGARYHYLFDSLFENELGVPLAELERDFRAQASRDFAEHRARADHGRRDGVPFVLDEDARPYRDLTPEQRQHLAHRYSGRVLRYHRGRLYYRRGETIHHAKLAPSGTELEDEQVLGRGVAFAPHTESSAFVLRQTGHDPTLLPSFYRPRFESPTLFLVDADGEERVLLEESRLSDFDVCAKRRELAGIHNDGDGSLVLVLYPLRRFGTPEVAVDRGRARFPLPRQVFDEVRTPRYDPDCKRLFFSRRVGDDHDVYALDLATGNVEAFAAEDAFELYPEPAERGAYFVSARDGTMSVYYKAYDGSRLVRVTRAVTAHHYPVATPHGLFFIRMTGTGFQPFVIPRGHLAAEPVAPLGEKRDRTLRAERLPPPQKVVRYDAFSPKNAVPPLFVPLLDLEYDHPGSPSGTGLSLQAGLDFYVEDQLRTHSLRVLGFLGSRNSIFVGYRNAMTPLTLEARAGMTQMRSVYEYRRSDGERFDHVLDYRWGFLYASASLPLDLFHWFGLEGETLRDLGTTVGASARLYDFTRPRYARDRVGFFLDYFGIDRSDPAFRERVVNRRGYRELRLRASYAVEEIHRGLASADPTLRVGRTPYLRAELEHTEYLALPKLLDGWFDHTLELGLRLGWISRDIRFLPFFGGGRLSSQTAPELNTSVGFAGYGAYALSGETLANVGASYRFPIARGLGWDAGPFYLEDVYAQVFTSWGNVWGFHANGRRQIPFLDRAPNGRFVLGDAGLDLRFYSFLQEVEANVGTTMRVVYRAIPFATCPADAPDCLRVNGRPGLVYYLILGGGF